MFRTNSRSWWKSHRSWWSNGSQVSVVLQKIFLQFGQDMFAVCVFSQSGNVRSNFVHENLSLAVLGHIYHLLDHVVGVLVLHHDVQCRAGTVWVGGADLVNEDSSLWPVGILNTFLHHVTGEFVLRQVKHFTSDTRNWK